MPLVSYISAYLFYPISGDYIMSLALGYALTLTGFIVAYFYLAYRLLRQKVEITDFQALSVTTIFIILHFLVYRTEGSNNAYVFRADNVTCIFYYTIPTLLNIILILYFECRGEIFAKGRHLQNGGVLLLIYLAIFSNLFSSCLLPIWCGVRFLEKWIHEKRFDTQLLKEGASYLLIIMMWLISMGYELTGGRADSVGDQFGLANLWKCTSAFILQYISINRMALEVIVFCVVVQIACLVRGKKAYMAYTLRMIMILMITGLYLIILCTKVGADYLVSKTYINTTVVLLLLVYYSLGLCIREYSRICVLIPLVTGILFYNINVDGGAQTFSSVNLVGNDTVAYRCSTYIVNMVQQADEQGMTTLEIHVPRFNDGDNWPLPTYGGGRISDALYKHGVTATRIEVNLVPDENVTLADMQ